MFFFAKAALQGYTLILRITFEAKKVLRLNEANFFNLSCFVGWTSEF